MPIFSYKAKNESGVTVEGIVEAPDEAVAADLLISKKFLILSIAEKRHLLSWIERPAWLNRVRVRDLVIFSRQLSVMISANLTLVEALRILVKQTENPKLKLIISEITDEVDGGASLSQTLARYPHVFNHFFVNMVRSGETSGRLDEVLNYLADQLERDYELMSKIKGAMTYPVFIVGALVVVGAIMMIVVIPKLTAVLIESGQELPFATRALIGTSDFLKSFWWLLLIMIIGAVTGFKMLLARVPGVRPVWDRAKVRVPVFGKLLRHIYLVRFTRSLGTLLEGGVTLPLSLEITAEVVGNAGYHDLLISAMHEVEDGHSLTSVFAQSKIMPAMVTNMLSAGEETGKVELVLKRLTEFYSRDVDNMVGNLVSLIEPVIMIVLGVAVGVIVAAIILPMYNLASAF